MSVTNRQEQILNILNERTFITVNELAKITFTSPSSIRRDLTYLQNNGLAQRTHGGVSIPNPIKGVASFYDRSKKNIREKRIIAQKAAHLLKDGQSIILDSSSTATFMLPYIAKFSSNTIFTNNLSTALRAIELGINTYCIGGHAINDSVVLSGTETYKTLSNIKADILFFSSQSLNINGDISDSTEEENYVRMLMIESSKKSVFLCDNEKFNKTSLHRLCNIDDIDIAVFNESFEGLNTKSKIL